jgi:ParB/RepB/Spo0J family partition protein
MELKLEQIDTDLLTMRLMRPGQIKEMASWLARNGQLQPIIVNGTEQESYQVIDGFKRYYAAKELGWGTIKSEIIRVNVVTGKAMILSYNRGSHSLVEYEEALIVHSLSKDHRMEQKAISELLGYSRSWVCRRIALIEKLDGQVQDELRLGCISNSQARGIVKLPRGNQKEITKVIIAHKLTSRQSNLLIEKYMQTGDKQQQAYILNNPVEVLNPVADKKEIYDVRLGEHGNRLLKAVELLRQQQNIFIGQYTHHQTKGLKENEREVLRPKIQEAKEKSQKIITIINQKTG